jgi:hypothetical protein
VVARNYVRHTTGVPTIAAGTKLPLKNASWQSGDKTIVLAISTTCHFCTDSADFYRKLVLECKRRHVHTIAVLPQSTDEAESYLKNEGVAVDEVRQAALSDLHINGTPTLLLVDGSRIVRSVWVGKLASEGEKQVLAKLAS